MNNFTSIRNITSKLNSYQIFILSFLICLGFYSMEWLIGIDRFYHPDSLHYLSNYQDFKEPRMRLSNFVLIIKLIIVDTLQKIGLIVVE